MFSFDELSQGYIGSFPMRADGHCDTLTAETDRKKAHIDLEYIEQHMDMQFMAIYVREENDPEAAKAACDRWYYRYRTLQTEEYYDQWIPLKNDESFRRLSQDNIGIILAMENCAPLGTDEDAVYDYFDKGFRSFGITWSNENCFAGGAFTDTGLKPAGERLLYTMNRLPVAVDLAHINERSFYDAMAILENPPIVTHTCCYDLVPHCRNLKENQMKELRMAGGLMGITFVNKFLNEDPDRASVDDIIDHILYASDYMGIDKICLGSDFDGAELAHGIDGIKDLPLLYQRMRERDFSKEEINMIAGENLFRYMLATLAREES